MFMWWQIETGLAGILFSVLAWRRQITARPHFAAFVLVTVVSALALMPISIRTPAYFRSYVVFEALTMAALIAAARESDAERGGAGPGRGYVLTLAIAGAAVSALAVVTLAPFGAGAWLRWLHLVRHFLFSGSALFLGLSIGLCGGGTHARLLLALILCRLVVNMAHMGSPSRSVFLPVLDASTAVECGLLLVWTRLAYGPESKTEQGAEGA